MGNLGANAASGTNFYIYTATRERSVGLVTIILKTSADRRHFRATSGLLSFNFTRCTIITPRVSRTRVAPIGVGGNGIGSIIPVCGRASGLLMGGNSVGVVCACRVRSDISTPIRGNTRLNRVSVGGNSSIVGAVALMSPGTVRGVDFGCVLVRVLQGV